MDYLKVIENCPELFTDTSSPIRILIDLENFGAWRDEYVNKLRAKSYPEEWADIGIVLNDPYIIALRDLVEFPGGYRSGYLRIFNRAYLEGGAAGAVILPILDGKILLLNHFRHATRKWHWEFPRGFGESGESADRLAARETLEETEGEIAELVNLGLFFNNTGLEGNPIYLFLAKLSSVGNPEQAEAIESFRWVTVPELEQMIASAEITDGFTIAAYTRAKLRGLL